MQTNKSGKGWRVAVIILVGMTAAMNLLGGIGTTCAAFFTKQYPPMWALYDYQWLYQAFVVVTALIGLAGIWTLVKLLRGGKNVLRDALIVLVLGAIVNIIHVAASISLRGKATPADVVMGINLVTLLLVLFLGTPGMRQKVRFDQQTGPNERAAAGGIAAIVAGLITLTTPIWAGPTHMFEGVNWVNLLLAPLMLAGGALLVIGVTRLGRVLLDERLRARAQARQAESTSAM
jgi:hypothetical protein